MIVDVSESFKCYNDFAVIVLNFTLLIYFCVIVSKWFLHIMVASVILCVVEVIEVISEELNFLTMFIKNTIKRCNCYQMFLLFWL